MNAYKHGMDVLGASDVSVKDWDNSQSFAAGDIVRYYGGYYKATRSVTAPMIPFLQAGEVPGVSDAWKEVKAESVIYTNVSGTYGGFSRGDYFGMFDIASEQHRMNALKQVPVSVAKSLLKGGQQVIANAITLADAKNLPGSTARKNVQDHLLWHANAIKGAPESIYASGEDLKKWTMEAFIESNSVEDGAAWIGDAWNQLWSDIEANIKALPATVAKTVGNVVSAVVPWWVWPVGAGVVGLVGFTAYKVLTSDVGKNALGTAIGYRLGGRR
jgi:hypothetical protein